MSRKGATALKMSVEPDSGIDARRGARAPMAEPVTSVKDVFEVHIPAKLKAKPDVVAKINAIYQFNISGPGGGSWAVDCTQPGGKVETGTVGTARCTVAASAQHFLDIVNGKLNPQMAFMSGKLKIQGDMGLAMKLQQILT
jgi:putative sterol carrier protein